MAKVTILMNCLNGERFAKSALDSVLKQTYQDIEILFVDNASTDRTADIVRSFNDLRIRYKKTPVTIPLYASRDFGLDFIDTEYTCFLDIDDFWVHNKIERQLHLIKDTQATLLYTNFKNNLIDMGLKHYVRAKVYYQRKFWKRGLIKPGYRDLHDLLMNYDINLQTVMIKTEVLKSLRFNGSLNWFGDADVFLRHAKQPDCRIYYSDIVTSYTSIHAKQLSRASTENNHKELTGLMNSSYRQIFSSNELELFKNFLGT